MLAFLGERFGILPVPYQNLIENWKIGGPRFLKNGKVFSRQLYFFSLTYQLGIAKPFVVVGHLCCGRLWSLNVIYLLTSVIDIISV